MLLFFWQSWSAGISDAADGVQVRTLDLAKLIKEVDRRLTLAARNGPRGAMVMKMGIASKLQSGDSQCLAPDG